ncbi:hypothetical protein EDC04DRAFT_2831949 [Pisolithus marmoratus]|nr:hypothetical protein EDC04DRAFT_2831949 [Pisolithus marmoratus]
MCCAVKHFSASVSPITCTITVCMASLLTQPWVGAAAGRRITQITIVGAGSDLLRYSTKCRSLITACKCLYGASSDTLIAVLL